MRLNLKQDRIQVASHGGGTQSSAIAVLVYQGILPKPDLFVMADTGRECSVVFPYFFKHIKPLLDEIKVPCHFVSAANIDTFTENKTSLPPFFSEYGEKEKPNLSRQRGFCSGKWKTDVIKHFLSKNFKGEKFQSWIGYTTDEIRRAKPTSGKYEKIFPLLSLRLNRQDCIKIVENAGLPTPPRSACYMCPNRSDSEWQWLKENVPDDFEKASEYERQVQVEDPALWLNTRGIPINQIDFDDNHGQSDLFKCEGGAGCFT